MPEKFRLLIVNDNPITLEVMRNMARRHQNIDVDVVVLAADALGMIQSNPPYHIILTDLTTPYFTGTDVLKAAKARSPDTKVLLVTSFGNHQGIIDAIKLGVFDYLHKPFRPEELNLKLMNAELHFQQKQRIGILEEALANRELGLREKGETIERLQADVEDLKKSLAEFTVEEDGRGGTTYGILILAENPCSW